MRPAVRLGTHGGGLFREKEPLVVMGQLFYPGRRDQLLLGVGSENVGVPDLLNWPL